MQIFGLIEFYSKIKTEEFNYADRNRNYGNNQCKFDFLNDETEDVYTLEDGKPVRK